MKIKLGIDLGTTFSAAAYVNPKTGRAEVIKNIDDNNAGLLPSVALFLSEEKVLTGNVALNDATIYPDKVVQFAKRYIGDAFFPRPVDVPEFINPVTFSAIILRSVKNYVEEQGFEIEEAVVTVPAYFDFNQRNFTKQAAVMARIALEDKIHIINEPTAAALYYCYNRRPADNKFLVYDLGGGTFDAVLVRIVTNGLGETLFKVLATEGDHMLGGKDWDDVLSLYLFDEARKQLVNSDLTISDISSAELKGLILSATKVKEKLTQVDETVAYISLFDKFCKENDKNRIVEVKITREKFNSLTAHLLKRTTDILEKMLENHNISKEMIDKVLLVGGSTFMPMVREYVAKKFGEEKIIINEPNLAVAYGAAIFAQHIPTDVNEGGIDEEWFKMSEQPTNNTKKTQNIKIQDIAPWSIGTDCRLKWAGEEMPEPDDVVIENFVVKGETLPIRRRRIYNIYGNGYLHVSYYENTKCGEVLTDVFSLEEFCELNQDAFVFGKRTREVPYFEPNDDTEITFLGEIHFNQIAQANDEFLFDFAVSVDGIGCVVTHLRSRSTKNILFKNDASFSEEKMEIYQHKLDWIAIVSN